MQLSHEQKMYRLLLENNLSIQFNTEKSEEAEDYAVLR